jgi:hypothetical protein
MTSGVACVLKCQQTFGCKAATFRSRSNRNIQGLSLCTLYDTGLRNVPEKIQRMDGVMLYEEV